MKEIIQKRLFVEAMACVTQVGGYFIDLKSFILYLGGENTIVTHETSTLFIRYASTSRDFHVTGFYIWKDKKDASKGMGVVDQHRPL